MVFNLEEGCLTDDKCISFGSFHKHTKLAVLA